MEETRREQWARLLSEQAASGLSKKAFCQQQGLKLANFYYWQKRLRQEISAGFTQLAITPADCQLSVRFSGGEWIEVKASDWRQLACLLHAMSQAHA